MAERVERETVVTEPRVRPVSTVGSVLYILLGLLEAALAFRFFFLLLGANPNSGFVSFIYGLTDPLVSPFYSVFGTAVAHTGNVTSVFDPNTLLAMAVYGLVGWAIIRLIVAATGRPVDPS